MLRLLKNEDLPTGLRALGEQCSRFRGRSPPPRAPSPPRGDALVNWARRFSTFPDECTTSGFRSDVARWIPLSMPPLTVEYIKHATGEFDEESVFQAILPNRSITRIEQLAKCCNLRWLDLSKNQIVRMENLDGLSQLVSVDLSFNKISKVQDLSGTPKLERLMLKANPISKIQDLEGLKASRSLRHLSFQNVDNSDACPVCSLPEYAKSLRSLCPELLALDSKRLRLPDLDREIRRLDEQNAVDIPEPRPWFSAEELDLGEMQTSEVIEEALKDRIGEFEAAMADCKQVQKNCFDCRRLADFPQVQKLPCLGEKRGKEHRMWKHMAYSADRRQQDAEAAQAVRERQYGAQLVVAKARLVARALQHQYADVKRLEAATRQESQYAAQLESKDMGIVLSQYCMSWQAVRGQILGKSGKDCAAVAEVPVDLLGAVGWGQLEVQEAQLSLARTSAARMQLNSVLVLIFNLIIIVIDFNCCFGQIFIAAVFLRNEYNELQAESAREQEDEKACSDLAAHGAIADDMRDMGHDLLTESFLLNQSREAAQSLRGQVGQIDAALSPLTAIFAQLLAWGFWKALQLPDAAVWWRKNGVETHYRSMLEMEHARAEELIAHGTELSSFHAFPLLVSYACAWEHVHKLQRAVRAEEVQKKAMQERATEAVLESEAADAQLLKARAKCEVAAAALSQGRQLAMDRGADLRGRLKERCSAQACLSEEIEEGSERARECRAKTEKLRQELVTVRRRTASLRSLLPPG
ncbi:Lrrc61 [Symbiodinium sp. KB8]|nr:Lrrc61 [Symbiodinium sp. KB8]